VTQRDADKTHEDPGVQDGTVTQRDADKTHEHPRDAALWDPHSSRQRPRFARCAGL
jgi:hypothetical protein